MMRQISTLALLFALIFTNFGFLATPAQAVTKRGPAVANPEIIFQIRSSASQTAEEIVSKFNLDTADLKAEFLLSESREIGGSKEETEASAEMVEAVVMKEEAPAETKRGSSKSRETKSEVIKDESARTYSLDLADRADLEVVLRELNDDPSIAFAQPNYLYAPDLIPNDPVYQVQYAHTKTNAASAWDLETGDPSVVIAVIGTGVKWDHQELAANIWSNVDEVADNSLDDDNNGFVDDVRGWNFEQGNNNPAGTDGHETSVAGVAAAVGNNALGITGICWSCTIMPLRVNYSTIDVANAIYYAVDNGAKVVNMSFGNYDITKYGSDTLVEDAIDYGLANNVLMVATAGNDSISTKRYPGALEQVIGVASTDQNDNRSTFSNWGEWVDVAAPGTAVHSTVLAGGWSTVSGTSFSAPYVSGLAGLMFARNPALSISDARLIIEYTADTISTDLPIGGRVNSQAAVAANTVPVPVAVIKLPWNNLSLPETGTQEVWGTVLGDSYVLEYRPVGGTWTELSSGGEVVNGTLGVIDLDTLPLGNFELRLTASGNSTTDVSIVNFSHDTPVPSFPVHLGTTPLLSPVTAADLNDNGTPELILGNINATVYAIDYNGTASLGWPKTISSSGIYGAPAVGDITGDAVPEVVVATNGSVSTGGSVSALSADGTLLSGWPKSTGQVRGSVMLANLDADPELEVIFADNGKPGTIGHVNAWNGDGTVVPGWPYSLSESNIQSSPAFGDVDGDAVGEIVVASFNKVYVLEQDGSLLAEWNKPSASQSSPILVDIDGDGTLEIAIGNSSTFGVYTYQGVQRWSASIGTFNLSGQAAAGDVDGDGLPEIFFGRYDTPYRLYGWDAAGQALPGYPITMATAIEAPTIGDVDGDSAADIAVVTRGGELQVYNAAGALLPTFPRSADGAMYRSATMTDLDNDGDIELVSSTENGSVYAWDLDGAYVPANLPWAHNRHDARNTGAIIMPPLPPDVTPPTVSITSPTDNEPVTGVVTINADAADNKVVNRVEFYADGGLIASDTTSPYSASWDTSSLPVPSSHVLTAVAFDNAGNNATSTVVNVHINDTIAPTVSLTAPSNGATVSGSSVTISANASDNVGVAEVKFYDGANLITTDSSSPYGITWDTIGLANGNHSLTAVATDAANNPATSTVVTVNVNNDITAPATSLTAPANGATVSGSAVTISASASDNVGVVDVKFYDDTNLIATDASSPYSIVWNTIGLANGNHSLTSVARDAAGNTATSTPRVVTVNNDITAPTVSITSPVNGGTVRKNRNTTIKANAADNIGVTQVQFTVNDVLKCTDTSPAYTCTWAVPNVLGVQYQLRAIARDAAGNYATSTVVTVTSVN